MKDKDKNKKINISIKIRTFLDKMTAFTFLKTKKKYDNKSIKAKSIQHIEIKSKSLKSFFDEYNLVDKNILGKRYYFWERVSNIGKISRKISKKVWTMFYKCSYRLVVVSIALILIYSMSPGALSAPQSKIISTKIQWEEGTLNNISTTSKKDAIQLKADGSWTARSWAPTPDNISFGSTSALVEDYLYVTRGYGDKAFYRYNIKENKWDILNDLPQPAHYGCDISYDGNGNLYFIFGGYSKKFYKYNIESGLWTQLPDLLDTVYYGSGIEFDGTDLYIVRGQNSTDFWKFDISENSWLNMAPTPLTVYRGGNIVYGNNGKMYVLRGYNRNTIWSYDISSNTWDSLTNAPTTFYGEQKGVLYNGYVYFLKGYNTNGFYRYNIVNNSWDTLETTPQNTRYSSLTYNSDDGYIYAVRGNGQYHLWKFDPEAGVTGEWIGPKNAPSTISTGGDLIWNEVTGSGAYVYAIRGNSNAFYRYDITNNDWSTMSSAPANLSYDTKGTYYNGNIYIPRGSNTGTFYRYNIAGNSWSTMTDAPVSLRYGSSATYNSGDGYIYVTRGNGSDDFYRYDINTDSWDSSVSDIITNDGTSYRVYVGGRLESDGTDLYLMPGDGETAFLKYDTSADTWIKLSATSFAQYYGTDMTYRDGKIYALAGYYKDELWEYDITNDIWRQLPSNQDYTYGRGPSNGASIVYAGGDSFYATPGFGLSDMWSYTLGVNNYLSTGAYISSSIDLAHVTSWISLTATDDTPANTAIIYETRTSSDGENWSTWSTLDGTNIQSQKNRYIQVKATLNTNDGISTPTVYDFTISYNSEDNPPTNPTNINAFSQQVGGDSLVSETSYKHSHPYFSWTGASDDDSGVAGYYVYFGNDNEADPVSSGVYQTESNYNVNLALTTGNYYLRIKTKDMDDNISDMVWNAFTYNYAGVSPPLTNEKTSQADFENGTLENISTTNEAGSLQLGTVDGFWNESKMSYAPGRIRYGGNLIYVESEGKLYTFRGNNTLNFYSYDLATNTWETLANTPETVRMGGAIARGPDGYLYGTRGNNTSTFWRYDIVNNLWEIMASAPKNFYYGGSLSYDGNRYIYGLPGNDDAFYRYDTQSNQWTSLTNAEFGNPNEGDGQRVYVGSDTAFDNTNAIYTLQGNYYPYFAKYTINDNEERNETADTWTSLAQAPIGVYAGGSLSYDNINNALYALGGNWRQNFYKYDIASDVWSELPQIPVSVEYGASLKVVGNYVYAIRGGNSTAFYRFNIDNNTWEVPQRGFFGPSTTAQSSYFGFYYGTEMAEDDEGNIFIVRGYHDNTFGKYNIQTGMFIELARTPVGIYNGSAMIYNQSEGAVYLTSGDTRTRRSGNINNYFMKYTVANNTWEIISNDRVPYQTGYGSSMAYDGSRYIYLTRGSNSNNWWRYDTQATEGSRWSSVLPTISGWTQGYGGRIIYKNGYIYSNRGQNTNTFWRYDVAGGTWLQMENVPGNVYIGGSLSDGKDGYLYLTRGYNTNKYYRYNITGNSWEEIGDIPAQIYQGGASVNSGSRIWTTSGTGSNSYRDGLYSYVIGSSDNNTGFKKTGTYVSENIDLLAVYRWANLTVNYTKPNNTDVVISTRSSEDGVIWSAWDQVSNEKELGSDQYRYNIVSPANNYLQVKFVLTSRDQIFSPLIKSYNINYYQDIQAPNNPTAISAYGASDKVNTITSNTWYNNATPYFEWPADETEGGATDGAGGSGVIGYYVYIGTDSNADPFVSGEYQTENYYTASNLVSGNHYYLIIKAVDDAGIIPADSYQAFTYGFDNEPPINPSDISVTPAGYTASDSYEFLWESDAQDTSSGIYKLQYRTGGDTEDTWYDINDTATVSLTIPNETHIEGAYQSGKNWIYLRVVDNAGNVSDALAQEYYFSADAPSPPKNLIVTPENSENNSFAFEWEQPDSFIGDSSKLKYYYSVNTLPNSYNVTETTVKAAGPGPFATQKGANRFYVVAKDEADNIDYDLYAYVNFSANTTAPGAPINAQIFDTSDRESQEYSVAIKWSIPIAVDENNFAGYVIYRSDDGINFSEVATTSGTAYVDTELESKEYYYYVKSKDNTNNLSVASSTVSIIPTGRYTSPPTLVKEPSVTVQSFAANFTWATNRVASSFVEFGKTIKLGETNGQVDSLTDHTVALTGLSAGTKYYYRVKFIDPDGNIGTSEITTFETLPPPVVSDFAVSDIGLDSAYVSWKTNSGATCSLKYGAGSYSNVIEETANGTSHVQKINTLTAETSYQTQTSCIDGDGNEFSSDQYNFSTPVKPVVSDVTVENKDNVDLPTVSVKYKTNVPTSTLIYFKHSDGDSSHTFLTEEKVIEHSAEIKGLDPAKEYNMVITGIDENGIDAESVEQKITTRSDSRPPEIMINRAVGRTIGRGKNSQANIYVKIETNESTKVNVNYSKGVTSNFEQSTIEDPFNTYHLITIPAETGQVYSYQAKVFDEAGNLTTTKTVTIVVDQAKESAVELIGGTVSNNFGWITKIWKK